MLAVLIIGSILFALNAFTIVWAMMGYKISLKVLGRVFKKRKLVKDYEPKPTVSVMIVAHNEEKVILDKLNNVIDNDYPKDKIEYIVASDFSTDATNEIVEKFIEEHPELKLKLYCSKDHKGKTNAQNEAQKETTGEILVMTDANAMFDKNAISELVAAFTAENIVYVCGRLSYINAEGNDTASAESLYWEGDLGQSEVESNLRTITAGNGAIYAVRNSEYYDFPPIECHDSSMPYYYAKKKKRAIYNPDAVAYEKAGEVIGDEFKRKVRMNRGITKQILEGIKAANIFKYGWFSYFYFGHRTCRYLLWLAHAMVLIIPLVLGILNIFNVFGIICLCLFGAQVLFYVLSVIGIVTKSKNKLIQLMAYYTMTIAAQWKGVYNCVTGKSKPTWSSAQTTR